MTHPQIRSNAITQVKIERLHIRLRGMSPSQAKSMAESLGEQVLRQLASLLPGEDSKNQADRQDQQKRQRQVEVGEIRLSAPPTGIPQAIAQATLERFNSEG